CPRNGSSTPSADARVQEFLSAYSLNRKFSNCLCCRSRQLKKQCRLQDLDWSVCRILNACMKRGTSLTGILIHRLQYEYSPDRLVSMSSISRKDSRSYLGRLFTDM